MIREALSTIVLFCLVATSVFAIPPAASRPVADIDEPFANLWEVSKEPAAEPAAEVEAEPIAKPAAEPVQAAPAVTLIGDVWKDFSPEARMIENLTARIAALEQVKSAPAGTDKLLEEFMRRVERLEKTQLTEADVIRIVATNFSVVRVQRTVNGVKQNVAIANDVVDKEVCVPGFVGTFTVPEGGRVTSVNVWENGRVVEKKLPPSEVTVAYTNGPVHRTSVGDLTVYAAPAANNPGYRQVTTYKTTSLQSQTRNIGSAPPEVRRGLFGRIINPPVRSRGSQCVQQGDGSWKCN